MAVSASPLHVTICVMPTSSGSVATDLNLVRSCLLYVDHISLCSLNGAFWHALKMIDRVSEADRLSVYEKVLPVVSSDSTNNENVAKVLKTYRTLLNIKYRNSRQIIAQNQLRSIFEQGWTDILKGLNDMSHESGMHLLNPLIDQGLIDIKSPWDASKSLTSAGIDLLIDSIVSAFEHTQGVTRKKTGEASPIVESFSNSIFSAVVNQSTFPLLDESAGEFVKLAIDAGRIKPNETSIGAAKHINLATNLLEYLPSLDRAKFDELVSIRRELNGPLARFRAAILGFSEDIKSMPWDVTFQHDSRRIYLKQVAPCVEEIRDEINSKSYLAELMYASSNNPGVSHQIGSLVPTLGHSGSLPELISAHTGIEGARVATQAFQKWQAQILGIRQNQLFFCYRVGEMLSMDSLPEADRKNIVTREQLAKRSLEDVAIATMNAAITAVSFQGSTNVPPETIPSHDQIIEAFSLDDLRKACYELNLIYENLSGDTLSAKSIALLELVRRQNIQQQFNEWCRKERPNRTWIT